MRVSSEWRSSRYDKHSSCALQISQIAVIWHLQLLPIHCFLPKAKPRAPLHVLAYIDRYADQPRPSCTVPSKIIYILICFYESLLHSILSH